MLHLGLVVVVGTSRSDWRASVAVASRSLGRVVQPLLQAAGPHGTAPGAVGRCDMLYLTGKMAEIPRKREKKGTESGSG